MMKYFCVLCICIFYFIYSPSSSPSCSSYSSSCFTSSISPIGGWNYTRLISSCFQRVTHIFLLDNIISLNNEYLHFSCIVISLYFFNLVAFNSYRRFRNPGHNYSVLQHKNSAFDCCKKF